MIYDSLIGVCLFEGWMASSPAVKHNRYQSPCLVYPAHLTASASGCSAVPRLKNCGSQTFHPLQALFSVE